MLDMQQPGSVSRVVRFDLEVVQTHDRLIIQTAVDVPRLNPIAPSARWMATTCAKIWAQLTRR